MTARRPKCSWRRSRCSRAALGCFKWKWSFWGHPNHIHTCPLSLSMLSLRSVIFPRAFD